jgi:hypothetical protein
MGSSATKVAAGSGRENRAPRRIAAIARKPTPNPSMTTSNRHQAIAIGVNARGRRSRSGPKLMGGEAPARTGDLIPQIAVDNSSGALYVVWQDDRFTGEEQIAFSRSIDGGRTWSATRRISTVGGVNQAFTATPRVASNGTVAVQYYDFRVDNPATTPPLTTDTTSPASG